MEKESQKRIAVVGSGLAGLLTSYLLQQDTKQRYAVTLFEEVSLSRESIQYDSNIIRRKLSPSMLPLFRFRIPLEGSIE